MFVRGKVFCKEKEFIGENERKTDKKHARYGYEAMVGFKRKADA